MGNKSSCGEKTSPENIFFVGVTKKGPGGLCREEPQPLTVTSETSSQPWPNRTYKLIVEFERKTPEIDRETQRSTAVHDVLKQYPFHQQDSYLLRKPGDVPRVSPNDRVPHVPRIGRLQAPLPPPRTETPLPPLLRLPPLPEPTHAAYLATSSPPQSLFLSSPVRLLGQKKARTPLEAIYPARLDSTPSSGVVSMVRSAAPCQCHWRRHVQPPPQLLPPLNRSCRLSPLDPRFRQ